MPSVRIRSVPPGEAPLEVRRAWVGLVLPLEQGAGGLPLRVPVFGVLSAPGSFLGRIWALLTGGARQVEGYVMDPRKCIDILEHHDKRAAMWWRDYAPHMLKPGKRFVFPADVCEVVFEAPPEGPRLK